MRNADLARLARYAISGGLSALTHVGVGLAGTSLLHLPAVPASTLGFTASVAVSYLLQHAWVFHSGAGHAVAGPRFLTVTAAALGLNTAVLWIGADLLRGPYLVVQAVALVLIPVLNYALNSRWTFAHR
ncbi:GtrA family protein [Actinoplanes aureus]|uniref:GtrA family protein n=1 Tax=Actinoplanes aureus TaxID=2792083 RepID=A0A931CBW2_9ACTN|nr:GtrA family protein [Actinoplanes aureus]MBG0562060.1 GtrA family protein [Actinoplanes aureus]